MARIRSIHPGLLTDEAYMSLTVEQPLAIALYLGLLMESDDFGVFEWKPMTIKARVLPAASADVNALLQALVDHRFIAIFTVDERKLGAIRNFCKYQRPKKPHAIHPRSEAINLWTKTGTSLPESETGSEPVRNQSDSCGEFSPQMEDGGGRMEDGGGAASAAAARPEQSSLQVECRKIVGEEPVLLAQDFFVLERMLEQGLTEVDITTGIREALEKRSDPVKRYRRWESFAGWCRTAAQNRLANNPRAPPTSSKPPAETGPIFDFGNGFRPAHSTIQMVWGKRKWLAEWGPRPDESGCKVPADLMAKIMQETEDA